MTDKSNKKIKVKSWYTNRYQIVVVQRNVLFMVAIICIITVAVSVLFVKNFMSSKSLEPYVIEIDDKTGMASVVEQISSKTYTANDMVRRYFINKYIQSSLGYNPQTYREDSESIRLFSSSQIYGAYRTRINPFALGADSKIDVKVTSMIFKENSTVEIRITKNLNISGQGTTTKNEIIIMNFAFVPELGLSMEERLINPLGFQVTKFDIGDAY